MMRMLANVQQQTIQPIIEATIATGAKVYTDEYDIYSRLSQVGLSAPDRLPQQR